MLCHTCYQRIINKGIKIETTCWYLFLTTWKQLSPQYELKRGWRMWYSLISVWGTFQFFWDSAYLESGASLKSFLRRRRSCSLDRMKGRAVFWFWVDETITCSHKLSRSPESREAKTDVAALRDGCHCLKVQVCLISTDREFPPCSRRRQQCFLLEDWIYICGRGSASRLGQRAWAWRRHRARKGTEESKGGMCIWRMVLFWPGRELWSGGVVG